MSEGDWDPMTAHYKQGNIYRANQVTAHRDGSSNESDSEDKQRSLFIGNIPAGLNAEGLRNLLCDNGMIKELKLVKDKRDPGAQFAFLKTFKSADAIRIINDFNGYRLNNRTLHVHIQRPKIPSGTGTSRPPCDPNSLPLQNASLSRNSVSSDTSVAMKSPPQLSSGEQPAKPLGRSKGLLEAALRGHRQEPRVGLLSTGSHGTNGIGPRLSHSGSSSDELLTTESSVLRNERCNGRKFQSQESTHPPSSTLPIPPLEPSSSLKHGSHAPSPASPMPPLEPKPGSSLKMQVSPSASSMPSLEPSASQKQASSRNRKIGTCIYCGAKSSSRCMKCHQHYCSRECQKADWSHHRINCKKPDDDEEEFESRFEVLFPDDFLEKIEEQSEIERTVLPLHSATQVFLPVPASSPSEFYVLPKRNHKKLEELCAKLQEHYSVKENRLKLNRSPKIGDLCASMYSADGCWYRAAIEAIRLNDQRVDIRFVDYGNKETVAFSEVHLLAEIFSSIPFMVVQCCLSNIEPLNTEGGGDNWSLEAIRLSKMLIGFGEATITPVRFRAGVYITELTDSDGADVAEQFVKAGLAKFVKKSDITTSCEPHLSSVLSVANQPNLELAAVKQLSIEPAAAKQGSMKPATMVNHVEPPTIVKHMEPDSRVIHVEPAAALNQPDFSCYGWPSDLTRLVGRSMNFEVVEYDPSGFLWIRIAPVPGLDTPPLMKLSLLEKYSLILPPREEVVLPEKKCPRFYMQDLPQLDLNDEVKVEVTIPTSPGNFFCHDVIQMRSVIGLKEQLKPSLDSPMPSFVPEENEIVFGYYAKYTEWYRVMVMKKSQDTVTCFVIDYGDEVVLPLDQVRPMPPELAKFAPQAFRCRLSVWNILQATEPVVKRFQGLVEGKLVDCKIVSRDKVNDFYTVILSDPVAGQSIASGLIDAFEKGF